MPDHRPPPRLRWHTEMVTRQPIFVVPGESTGSSSVRPMGATWGIRERGDSPALRARLGVEPRRVPREYACPVHGRFVRVETEDVEEVACSLRSWTPSGTDLEYPTEESARSAIREACGLSDEDMRLETQVCGLTASWAGSSCAIGIEPGMVTG